MEVPNHIKEDVKNSVGYSEAVNKESFMIGASVAFSRSEDFYKSTIESLTTQLNGWKHSCESVDADMKTIVTILNKYDY